MNRRGAALIGALVLAAAVFSTEALAYLKLGVRQGDRLITLKFNTLPVRYLVTNRDVPGVTAAQLRDAVGRAFTSWAAVPNVRLSSEFVGFTGAINHRDGKAAECDDGMRAHWYHRAFLRATGENTVRTMIHRSKRSDQLSM